MTVNAAEGLTVVVPSRGRPESIVDLWGAFEETTTNRHTELVVVCDNSDPTLPEYRALASENDDNFFVYPYDNTSMVSALNNQAQEELNLIGIWPTHLGFMGDDHRPRTVGWDQRYLDSLNDGALVVYGNDLLQGETMPTQVALDWRVVETLGYFAPPQFFHLCVDLIWKDWGAGTGRLKYLDDVIIEHLHPAAGKAVYDDNYDRVNNPDVVKADADLYYDYRDNGGLEKDVAQLRTIYGD